jgi:hypothetical protein
MQPRIVKGNIEYSLDIFSAFHQGQKRDCIQFQFETKEEFSHFQYRIAIDEVVKGRIIDIHLRGLKTKGVFLPSSGKAEGSVCIFDLAGEYRVNVYKPGQHSNAFQIAVSQDAVKLLRPVKHDSTFLEIFVRS